MRWRWCSDAEDVSEMELEGGRSSSRLLDLSLGGSDARLEGYEGSNEVGGSDGDSKGGRGHGCHGSLLLL
jgi:hypothetical protein